MSAFAKYFCSVGWTVLVVLPLKSGQAANVETNSIVGLSAVKAPCTNEATPFKYEIASLSLAKELAGQGKEEEAIRVCDELIRKGSFDARDALRQKGLCLHRLGRFAEACLCWEYMLRGRMAQSKDDDILLKLASTYAFSLRQPAKAEKYYQHLLKQQPPGKYYPDAQYQYAGIRYVAKDYTRAMALFQEHLRDFPGSVYADKVNEYLGLCKKAIEAQEMAVMSAKVKADEEAPPVVKKSRTQKEFEAAEALYSRKLFKEAFKTYQAVANDSYCRERDAAIYQMGQCCSELGKDGEAIRHWEKIVKPRLGETNTQYAVQSLKAIGDTYFDKLAEDELAMKYYRKLVATYPEDSLIPAVMEKIGIIYLYQGKMEEAKPIFESLRPATPDPNEPPTGLDRLIALCNGQAAPQLPDLKVVARDNRATVALRKADIFFTAMRYEEALKSYKTAEMLASRTDEGAYALMQEGRCHSQLRDIKRVRSCYLSFLNGKYQKSRWAGSALVRLGVFEIRTTGDEEAGKKALQVAADRADPEWAQTALYYLATLDLWEGRLKMARERFQELIVSYPQGPYVAYVTQTVIPQIMQKKERNQK